MSNKTKQTAICISEELIERIDCYIKRKEEKNPSLEISRFVAIRVLLGQGLELEEKGYILELTTSNENLDELKEKANELAKTPESLNEPVIIPPSKK